MQSNRSSKCKRGKLCSSHVRSECPQNRSSHSIRLVRLVFLPSVFPKRVHGNRIRPQTGGLPGQSSSAGTLEAAAALPSGAATWPPLLRRPGPPRPQNGPSCASRRHVPGCARDLRTSRTCRGREGPLRRQRMRGEFCTNRRGRQ